MTTDHDFDERGARVDILTTLTFDGAQRFPALLESFRCGHLTKRRAKVVLGTALRKLVNDGVVVRYWNRTGSAIYKLAEHTKGITSENRPEL